MSMYTGTRVATAQLGTENILAPRRLPCVSLPPSQHLPPKGKSLLTSGLVLSLTWPGPSAMW